MSAVRAGFPFVPHLLVGHAEFEPALVRDMRGRERAPIAAVVLRLSFEYAPCAPPDPAAEARARRTLESFGPIELDMVEDWFLPPGRRADYVLGLDADELTRLAFSAHAVPQLEALGFRVSFEPGYPWRAVGATAPWYVSSARTLSSGMSSEDWLAFELGIEVGARRVDLLPALVKLLERASPGASLERLIEGRTLVLTGREGDRVLVPAERVRVLLSILGDLFAGRSAIPRAESLRLATGLAALKEALGGSRHRGPAGGPGLHARDAEAERWLLKGQAVQALAEPAPEVPAPGGLQASLRPYQAVGLAWLQGLVHAGAGGVLADDMGLGKTLQTIAHVLREKEVGRLDRPALIVAPTSLVGNWARELARFAPSLRVLPLCGSDRREQRYRARRADVVLTSYPILVRDLEFLRTLELHLLILDEAQAIKNTRSQVHEAARALQARHRLCLTGTPIENNLGELWAQLDFLMPGILGSEEAFKHRYRIPIEREANRERLQRLREQVRPYILRRTKEEVVPELPPKTEIVRPVELRGAQRDLYESIRLAAHGEIRRVIEAKGFAASAFSILDALMKLRQVCCDPRLVPVAGAHAVSESAKLDLLFELLEQQIPRGRRVLVFSQFATMLDLIGRALSKRDIPYVSLTGATRYRERVVDAFSSGRVPVFLISLKAGGTGLNLTSADTVVHFDPWWNPAAQAQATDRAYRIGQKSAVFVYKLIVAGSVEERMLALQEKKRELATGVLAAGTGGTGLSRADVETLLAPLG